MDSPRAPTPGALWKFLEGVEDRDRPFCSTGEERFNGFAAGIEGRFVRLILSLRDLAFGLVSKFMESVSGCGWDTLENDLNNVVTVNL